MSLDDQVQMGEILNNLGCLAYMSGQPEAAHSYFRECMDVQFRALSDSLYERSAVIGQSISLNISIVKANIGFIRMVTKDLHVAVTAFENALMVSIYFSISHARIYRSWLNFIVSTGATNTFERRA